MTRALILAAAAATTLLAAGQAPAQPQGGQPPPGNYFQTCRNISTFGFGPDATMTAECRERAGRWRQTSIRYSGCERVENIDGALSCIQSRDHGPPPPAYGPPGPDYDRGERRGRAAITLFSGTNFSGQPFFADHEFTNLPREYNDRAMSLHIEGRRAWMVCVNSDFKGRCEVFDHDVTDLREFGLGGQISSMRPVR